MKTNKMIASWLAASAIIMLSVGSTSAMYGEWGWQGGQGQRWGWQNMSQYITNEQREELESMSMDERREYIQKIREENGLTTQGKWGHWEDHNPGDMIADIPASDLSDKEKEILSYGYSEELLARDVYNYLYELYGEEIFSRIADSEQKHMEAVEVLLDRYELDIPSGYGDLQSTYEALIAEWEKGLKEALEVGLQIEILDIEDIEEAIKETDNDDFKIVFTNIGGASFNHMKAFVNALNDNNLTTDIETWEFLSADDLESRWPLKYKLAERLEVAWVELPEQVSSETLKEKWPKDGGSHGSRDGNMRDSDERKAWMRDWKWRDGDSMRNNNSANYNKYANNSVLKAKYKSTYEVKYWSVISKMDDSALENFIGKVDDILEKVATGDYSDATKEKYNAMLLALREIAVDNIDEWDILEGLFD